MNNIKKLMFIFICMSTMTIHSMQQTAMRQAQQRLSDKKQLCTKIMNRSYWCSMGTLCGALTCIAYKPYMVALLGLATCSCCVATVSAAEVCVTGYKLNNLPEQDPLLPSPQDQEMR